MSGFQNDLAKMLRVLRSESGLSQAAVAAGLRVHRSTYSYYEEGKTMPDIHSLRILARIFGILPEAFFYPEEFAGKDCVRRRAPKKARKNPETIGALTSEEKKLIAVHRANGRG